MDADYATLIDREHVYVTGEPPAGVVVLRIEPDHAFLDVIAIEPRLQGTGLGRELMEFAEARTRELGRPELRLLTHELMTENLSLYAHLGYSEYDRRGEHGFNRVFLSKRLLSSDE
jgi:GNAT superfamily N-acetyltransferase